MYIALIIIGSLIVLIIIIKVINDLIDRRKAKNLINNTGTRAFTPSRERIAESTFSNIPNEDQEPAQEAKQDASPYLPGAYVPPELPVPDIEEPVLTNKEKGNQFENYVANCFKNRNIFSVLEWHQGPTSSEGVYGINCLNPDFKIRHKFRDNFNVVYWVECKYRSAPTIIFNEYQLKRYYKIQHDTHLKVIMVIGTGGTPDSPEEVFVVPLDVISSNVMSAEQLKTFKLIDPHATFATHIKNYFYTQVFKKDK
ncbi:MAG: hypothetical protein K2H47_07540 [Muribaculaceae bacterium]|nr:hypothetical protein [Muribaculaceae bacterium]